MRRRVREAGRRTFRAITVRNYRLYFTGQVISVSGTWMQTVAQASLEAVDGDAKPARHLLVGEAVEIRGALRLRRHIFSIVSWAN